MLKEKKIVKHISADDHASFRNLFNLYFKTLLIYARKFVDDHDAKDLVQDCFYELWENRKKIVIHKSLKNYLFTIIRNKCLKELRKQKAFKEMQDLTIVEMRWEEYNYREYRSSLLQFDIEDRIEQAFDKLPQRCREVFILSRKEDLSNIQIAEKLGISVKMVEKHITKALQLFRNELSDFLS